MIEQLPTHRQALLLWRFQDTRNPSLLFEAIDLLRQTVEEPATAEANTDARFMLGQALRMRYEVFGSYTDLEWALRHMRQAVEEAPNDPLRGSRMQELAELLLAAVMRMEPDEAPDLVRSHLDYADSLLTKSLSLANRTSVAVSRLDSLGVSKTQRAQHFPDEADSAAALKLLKRARKLARTPEDIARCNDHLGVYFMVVYSATEQEEALRNAVLAFQRAVEASPPDPRDRELYRHHLESAINARTQERPRRRARPAEWSLLRRMQWAVDDGQQAERAGRWDDAVAAYELAQESLDRLYSAQASHLFAVRQLGEAADLTGQLAYALCQADRPVDAMLAIEGGRGRMLSVLLGVDEADLSPLREAGRADLADQLESALTEFWDFEVTRARPDLVPADDLVDYFMALQANRETLLAEARRIPGLERLLAPPGAPELRAAAAGIPVIYLCCGVSGGAAIVVPEDSATPVHSIDLPLATLNAVHAHGASLMRANETLDRDSEASIRHIDECCRWLWDAVIDPLRDDAPSLVNEDIAAVACGYFGRMPLSAAWRSDPSRPAGRRYALDEMCISAIPSIRVLGKLRHRQGWTGPAKALIVADPQPTSEPDLPEARKEAARIEALLPDADVLVGTHATLRAALARLPERTLVHLAMHGSTLPGQALRWNLLFANDERWEMHEMARSRLVSAPLVTLSACQTAEVGGTAPDEVIGMPAALLQAGASGVIGSLWAVADDSTGLLMADMYARLLEPGGQPCHALRQAQAWLRDVTVGELTTLQDEAGTLDLTQAPSQARPYEHPYYWAAFQHVGVPGR